MKFFVRVLLVSVLLFFTVIPAAHADWWNLFSSSKEEKKSVSEEEKYGLSKKQAQVQEERMKNCNTLDMGCKLNTYFLNLGEQLIAFAMMLLQKFVVDPDEILKDGHIKEYFDYFKEFSWTLLTIFFMFHVIRILATSITESNSEFKMLLRKLVFTAAIMGSIPWIIESLLQMNNDFVEGMTGQEIYVSKLVGGLFLTATASLTTMVPIILVLTWAIIMLILAVQFTVRFAKIALLFIVGPLAVATNLNTEMNLFPVWWKDLLSTIFTQAVQILMFVLAVKMFAGVTMDNLVDFLGATGFLILIIKTPSFMKEWIWSSGAGGMTQKAGGTAIRLAQRAIVRRGLKN